jgi:hypothetical protein
MAARVRFAKDNLRRDWQSVMFTDRKKFDFKYPGAKVARVRWLRKGEQHDAPAVNHAMVVNVYAGITVHGVTKCHVVTGTSKRNTSYHNKKGGVAKNITAEEYRDVVKHTLLPEGERLMSGQGRRAGVMQQDNDPTHKAALQVMGQWNNAHRVKVSLLPNWPPNSPDLNLIENVWSYVQAKVDARGCRDFDSFKAAVMEEWEAVPRSVLASLFASMPKRLEKVIDLGGQKTRY